MEKQYRPTILAKWIWFTVLAVVLGWAFYAGRVHSQPMFAAEGDGIRIVLYDEPCELKEVVTNLPFRATWTEKGKEFSGCWGLSPQRVVMSYWADKTVSVAPVEVFQRVQGI